MLYIMVICSGVSPEHSAACLGSCHKVTPVKHNCLSFGGLLEVSFRSATLQLTKSEG